MNRDFRNIRVFLVEDEFLVASALQEDLEARGFHVFGPYPTLALAQAAVGAERYDVAIIDMNLRGQLAYPVADELMRRNVPLIILSGYSIPDMPVRFKDVLRLIKPYDIDATLGAIEKVLGPPASAA
ncbi:MAG TPA: response regulator [Reyranella sp.]|nr:response regulator [Reyranella sp.]